MVWASKSSFKPIASEASTLVQYPKINENTTLNTLTARGSKVQGSIGRTILRTIEPNEEYFVIVLQHGSNDVTCKRSIVCLTNRRENGSLSCGLSQLVSEMMTRKKVRVLVVPVALLIVMTFTWFNSKEKETLSCQPHEGKLCIW